MQMLIAVMEEDWPGGQDPSSARGINLMSCGEMIHKLNNQEKEILCINS